MKRPQRDFPCHDAAHTRRAIALTTLYINEMSRYIEEGRADEINPDFYTIEELEEIRERAQAKLEEFARGRP